MCRGVYPLPPGKNDTLRVLSSLVYAHYKTARPANQIKSFISYFVDSIENTPDFQNPGCCLFDLTASRHLRIQSSWDEPEVR